MKLPITVFMVTKNEEANIAHSLPPAVKNFEEVFVVDSYSTDKTAQIAKEAGAEVIKFKWDGQYPKKRQWCLDTIKTKYNNILMLDADEILTESFIKELYNLDWSADGYFVKSDLVWEGKHLKYGMKNNKLCLFKKDVFAYPIIDDLDIEGMGEIEGHYQPVPIHDDVRVGQIKSPIIHHSHNADWEERHDRYAKWEIGMNKKDTWPIDPIFYREIVKDYIRTSPFRADFIFIYGYILKGGFLDGKAGLDYARKRFHYNQRIVRESRQTNEK